MRTGRDEAVSIFETWREDRALLRVELRFNVLAAGFRARMIAASDAEIRLLSDDKASELTLPLRREFTFGYTDMRDFPKESEGFERLVVVFLLYNGDPEDSDHIALAEVKEP